MTMLLPLAQYRMDTDHMDGWGWSMGIVMLLAVVAIVLLVVWLIRSTTAHQSSVTHVQPGAPTESPAQILDRRLAQGDITPDDYQARMAILGQRTP